MRIKNKKGFTLIESMAAIAMIGMILTPMFTLQMTVFSSVLRVADRFHRAIQAKQFSFSAYREQPPQSKNFKLEKKEDKPVSMLHYSFGPVNKKSSLARVKGIYRQEVIASGLDKGSPEGASLQFVFKSEQTQL